jgi:hypothetical protein
LINVWAREDEEEEEEDVCSYWTNVWTRDYRKYGLKFYQTAFTKLTAAQRNCV